MAKLSILKSAKVKTRKTIKKLPFMSSLGESFKYIRESKSIELDCMAKMLGVQCTYLKSVERGERNITLSLIVHYCKCLDIEVDQILEFLG